MKYIVELTEEEFVCLLNKIKIDVSLGVGVLSRPYTDDEFEKMKDFIIQHELDKNILSKFEEVHNHKAD